LGSEEPKKKDRSTKSSGVENKGKAKTREPQRLDLALGWGTQGEQKKKTPFHELLVVDRWVGPITTSPTLKK